MFVIFCGGVFYLRGSQSVREYPQLGTWPKHRISKLEQVALWVNYIFWEGLEVPMKRVHRGDLERTQVVRPYQNGSLSHELPPWQYIITRIGRGS